MRVKKGREEAWEKDKEANKENPELVKFIEDWTGKMEEEIDTHKGDKILDILERFAHRYECECDTCGLSGAMFQVLCNRVIVNWKYGDMLDKIYFHGFYLGYKEAEQKKLEYMERELRREDNGKEE